MAFRGLLLALLMFPGLVNASKSMPDHLELTRVSDRTYSAIGATGPGTYENHGHNNNLTFIITQKGVVVFNGGDSYLLAKSFHNSIRSITDKDVKYVVNENAQGHSMLGNSYWRDQGVPIIAQNEAIEEFKHEGKAKLLSMQNRNKDKAKGTYVAVPDIGFEDRHDLDMGDVKIELHYFGPGHAPGDLALWIPQEKLLITGDLGFHQRLLAVFEDTDTGSWVESFDKMTAQLDPKIVIPGHGEPTTIDVVTKETRGYLVFLRNAVREILEQGGGLDDAYNIDQSQWSYLDTFEELAAKNAGRVYQDLEFEYF
ncbi:MULTISPECIES: MBL fold metallo-hydrolase [Marinobacter]|jgi:glyoxylase-like metal-dependent hydrolase (beta-lactamase superfamily II)|uniref:MBL fold metallo-hydrolase n=1 Tax=Marinobacter TaxID=2742 RepID=UPI002943689D|nr:MBL fold metallo-hydrolase [Marinobacter salarius]WOI20535.1 MBL fold metallo-hydrolase [Marinobacter salarius]